MEKAVAITEMITCKHSRQHQTELQAPTSCGCHRGSEITGAIEPPECTPYPQRPWPDQGSNRKRKHGQDKRRWHQMSHRSWHAMFLDDSDFPVTILRILPP